MDGWKVMHQTARVAAPRDPPVQHMCLHICLEENCFIIVLNSCCSKSASTWWSDAFTRRKLFFFADVVYLNVGMSFCMRDYPCRWLKVTFSRDCSTLFVIWLTFRRFIIKAFSPPSPVSVSAPFLVWIICFLPPLSQNVSMLLLLSCLSLYPA